MSRNCLSLLPHSPTANSRPLLGQNIHHIRMYFKEIQSRSGVRLGQQRDRLTERDIALHLSSIEQAGAGRSLQSDLVRRQVECQRQTVPRREYLEEVTVEEHQRIDPLVLVL